MSNNLASILTPIREFLFPFLVLAAVVYVFKLIIRKFDFFRATSKFLGQQIEVEAGSHPKHKSKHRNNELPEVIDNGKTLPDIPHPLSIEPHK